MKGCTALTEPNNFQAEQEILASCLMDSDKAKEIVRQLTPADFYAARHKEILSAVKLLCNREDEPTVAAIYEVLKNHVQPSDLAEIMKNYLPVGDRQNIKILKDNTYLRQLMNAARLIYQRAEAKDYQDIEAFAAEAENALSSIKPSRITDINDLLQSSAKRLEEFFDESVAREYGPLGYRLGPEFHTIEKRLDGIQQGLYLLGGTPNTGKTSFLCNLSSSLVESNEPLHIAFFSMDDTSRKVYFRLLAGISRKPINYVANLGPVLLNNKNLDEKQRGQSFQKIVKQKKNLDKLLTRLHIFDSNDGTEIGFIDETSLALKRKYGHIAVIVDGLSKVQIKGFKADATAKAGELSARLKKLANEINGPLIATAELRKLNHPGPPGLDDLKDSVQWAYDADVCMLAHNPWSAARGDSDKYRTTKAQINGNSVDFVSPILELNFAKNKISGFRGGVDLVLVPDLAIVNELQYWDELNQAERLFSGEGR